MLVCHRRLREACQLRLDLSPASGRQDHAISPSGDDAGRRRRIPVHRIPRHARDDRDTPHTGAEREGGKHYFRKNESDLFCEEGLERANRFDAACKIRFVVHEIFVTEIERPQHAEKPAPDRICRFSSPRSRLCQSELFCSSLRSIARCANCLSSVAHSHPHQSELAEKQRVSATQPGAAPCVAKYTA